MVDGVVDHRGGDGLVAEDTAPASICYEAAAVNRTHFYASAVADDRVGPC